MTRCGKPHRVFPVFTNHGKNDILIKILIKWKVIPVRADEMTVDELIEDIHSCLQTPEPADEVPMAPPPGKKRALRKALVALGTALALLLETVLLAAGGLYGVMYVLAKGPSPTARDMFVRSVRETSAIGFLANFFFSEEEILRITAGGSLPDYVESDSGLIQIPTTAPGETRPTGPVTDEWGLTDEDGDGIILQEVTGEGYCGYMMVVLDPSRVIMGSVPQSYGAQGYTVEQYVRHFDAVAGVNGGGFDDPNGKGNGSVPDGMAVFDGQIYYAEKGCRQGFAGFDSRHILHVGSFTAEDIRAKDIRYGASYGPVLVVNGEAVDPDILGSGVNPRTAIGQRSDGAVLLLVIDGRQVSSLGATFTDLAEVFLSYGAVNACNLDGGSSSMMWYQDEYINSSASVIGIRPIPTSFVVLKEGETA